ncbi:glycoside hydrolase [Rhypophila sp. PSN 637]
MTVQNLIDRVTANLGLRADPEDRQKDPAQPTFHISSKDHFVHPLPGTYPRLTRLSDGSILFAFTHFDEAAPRSPPNRSLKIARSIDGGKTFCPHGEVTSSTGDIDNMFLLQLPKPPGFMEGHGEAVQPILAAFRNHDFALDSASKYTHHRITICQSLDNGRKWDFLGQAVESSPPCGLWEPFLRLSKSRPGELQLFYSGELGPDDQDTFLTVSRDWGPSWEAPMPVTGFDSSEGQGDENGRSRDGMVGIAETMDIQGREVLVMVLETTRGKENFVVECLVSCDDGLNWGSRQSVYVPTRTGKRKRNAGSPQVASFADGEIAVVFMTDEDDDSGVEFQAGEDGQGVSRWPLGAKIKVLFGGRPDDGDGNGIVPAPAPGQDTSSLWPGVMSLDDDKLLVVYETGGIVKGRVIAKN